MVGLLLNSLLTFLGIKGAAFISATFSAGIFTPCVGLEISKLGSLSARAEPVTASDPKVAHIVRRSKLRPIAFPFPCCPSAGIARQPRLSSLADLALDSYRKFARPGRRPLTR